MKKYITILICMLFFGGNLLAEVKSLDDYTEAVKEVQKSNKILVLHFTGSKWCPYCIYMDKEVMGKESFIKYAKDNIVYMRLDFQANGKPTNEKFAEQNEILANRYRVRGFPTIVLVSPDFSLEKPIKGMQARSPEDLIKEIEDFKALLKEQKKTINRGK